MLNFRFFPVKKMLNSLFCLFVLIVFTSNHQTFCSLFKVKRLVIGIINSDIVIGLCLEILMRLLFCNHPEKSFWAHMGIEPGSSRTYLSPWTRALTLLSVCVKVCMYAQIVCMHITYETKCSAYSRSEVSYLDVL